MDISDYHHIDGLLPERHNSIVFLTLTQHIGDMPYLQIPVGQYHTMYIVIIITTVWRNFS